jgi:2-polyprenyl-3-methyl-5-hydroxy-6-metoxy-1,4-benzoquinol methylase
MRKDIVEEYYRKHHAGETGMRRYGFSFGGAERSGWLRARIGTGKDVLDIGCRDGTLTSSYATGNRVVGIDIDEDALAHAHATHGFEVHKLNLNVDPLPFADERFDVVVAGEVLEHLQFPDEAAREVRRVLRPGGLFVGSVPNAFRLRNRLKFLLGREFETDPTHMHQFSPEGLKRVLAGFRTHEIDFLSSRHLWLHPRLLGTIMVFACRK